MRNKLLKYNTITSIIYQIVVIICGFVLPRAVLSYFGSETNGLVNSITQFLSIVALMDMGVGASIASNLYKPLAERDWDNISNIITAARNFFNKLAIGLIIYVILLCVFYPIASQNSFDIWFVVTLIIIISANSFSQFYIGIVDNILLGADQRAYITYISQAVTHLSNTIICVALMKMGFGIHAVKLTTAILYILRPLIVKIYIKKNYCITKNVYLKHNPLQQKWNAMGQHISECVLDFTDVMILTLFSTLTNVSIYSVYNLVVYNIKQFFLSACNGTLALMGNMWAQNEKDELVHFFYIMEYIVNNAVVYIFGCTYILIVPFIKLYTAGINDANYIQPAFAFFICLAHASHCLRLPYFNLIKAVGHYKQTQTCFYISTIINILLSVLLVKKYGLVGVAIGTLVAMIFQTTWLCWYCYKRILNMQFKNSFKYCFMDLAFVALTEVISLHLDFNCINYWGWIFSAVKAALIMICVLFILNIIFDNSQTREMLSNLKNKVLRR